MSSIYDRTSASGILATQPWRTGEAIRDAALSVWYKTCPAHLISAAKVHGYDSIPLRVGQGCKGLITKDTGIGNENMNAAERVKSDFDNVVAIFRRANCGSCLAAS
jgi:hypothetical protein